jgi:hypothetical protein
MYSSRPRLVPTGPPSDGVSAAAAVERPDRDPFSLAKPLVVERARDPAISEALGRALRSSASKIASSAIR